MGSRMKRLLHSTRRGSGLLSACGQYSLVTQSTTVSRRWLPSRPPHRQIQEVTQATAAQAALNVRGLRPALSHDPARVRAAMHTCQIRAKMYAAQHRENRRALRAPERAPFEKRWIPLRSEYAGSGPGEGRLWPWACVLALSLCAQLSLPPHPACSPLRNV